MRLVLRPGVRFQVLRLGACLALGFALAAPGAPARATEVTVANDSTAGGVPSTPGNFFIPGEQAASWLTSPCEGEIVAAQVYWTSQFGGAPASQETAIRLLAAGTFPTPGAILTNQTGGGAHIVAPVLADGVLNEYRFLDPPADTAPLRVPVSADMTFVVSLELLNQSSGNPFAPGPGLDTDGCQPGLNSVFVLPGGWNPGCPLGLPGDFVIRAKVDCTECDDGLDNDGDGDIDWQGGPGGEPADPACPSASFKNEGPQCDDDVDNDGDTKIDWDGGSGGATADPQCNPGGVPAPTKNREKKRCGLGFELAVLLAPLPWARRRVRAAGALSALRALRD